jgi:hypothetical protein
MSHKICINILLHPSKREISNHLSYNFINVQVRYITIETNEVARIGYNGFLFPRSYSGEGLGSDLQLSTNAEKETCYIQYGRFFCGNSYRILYFNKLS